MIEAISAWVKTIILVVLFATFLDLLLPNNNMQKFIRVIVGLFIMLAIINPFVEIIQNRWFPEKTVAISIETSSADAVTTTGTDFSHERFIQETYKKELMKQIRSTVMAVGGVAEAKVVVELNEEDTKKKYCEVKRVKIYVKPSNNVAGAINKISVNNSVDQRSAELNLNFVNKIKQTITELYQLTDGQIIIKQLT